MTALDSVLVRLEGTQSVGDGFKARCPAHDDREPSLSVRKADDGKVLLQCFAGCETPDVVAAIGLAMRDLFPSGSSKNGHNRAEDKEWEIRDLAGHVVAVHARRQLPGGKKTMPWRLPDGTEGLGGQKTRDLPLYGSEHLADRPGEPVIIVEGEKTTDALMGFGFLALGTVTGSGGTPSRAVLAVLRGREVYLWADNDDVGSRHMDRIARELATLEITVWIITWPGGRNKGDDAADFVAQGGTRADLEVLLGTVLPWEPPSKNGHQAEEHPSGAARQGDAFTLSDVGNARRLIARHGKNLRYCFPLKTWYVWDGIRWAPDGAGQVGALAKDIIMALYAEAVQLAVSGEKDRAEAFWKFALRSESAPRVNAVVEMARNEPGIPVAVSELDSDLWLLNCRNGTLDLRNGGKLHEHRREDLITKVAPVEYHPQATHALWDRFLSQAIPDSDVRSYIQRNTGASLVGDPSEDLIVLFHGPGGTGKTTFKESIMAALGSDYSASADLTSFTTAKDPHAAHPDLIRLMGKRLVAISEIEGAGSSMAMLKRVAGGDSITARGLFSGTVEFRASFTVWLFANERPRVKDTDSGLWRRIREIPFVERFSSPDPSLRTRLKDPTVAGEAILAWAVEGCFSWQTVGVRALPELVKEATDAYKLEMDPLREFVQECIVEGPDCRVLTKNIRTAYLAWAKAAGVKPLGIKGLTQRLNEHYAPKRFHDGRGFEGIGLVEGA